MKIMYIAPLLILVLIPVGCSSPYAGTYTPKAQLMPGETVSNSLDYTPEALSVKLQEKSPALTIKSGGHYTYKDSKGVQEGSWRIENNVLYLVEEKTNGKTFKAGLRRERKWDVNTDGSFSDTHTYGYHGVAVVWKK